MGTLVEAAGVLFVIITNLEIAGNEICSGVLPEAGTTKEEVKNGTADA
jgi:hypothetical protein